MELVKLTHENLDLRHTLNDFLKDLGHCGYNEKGVILISIIVRKKIGRTNPGRIQERGENKQNKSSVLRLYKSNVLW